MKNNCSTDRSNLLNILQLTGKKYDIDTIINNSEIGGIYHDLIDSKDKMNSDYQSKYNQTYHAIDVELYKLNKKIDAKSRMINYKINNKKEKMFKRILSEVM